MSFDTDGFFSTDMEKFRAAVTSQQPTKAWFDYAHDLNRFALAMVGDLAMPSLADKQRFTLAALFIRTHQSAQAALILAERGMIGDARNVVRSASEGVIAMYGLVADAGFIDALTNDYRMNQGTLARIVLDEPDFRKSYSSTEIAQMEATCREVKALQNSTGKTKQQLIIKWDQIARGHCPDVYNLLYRPLSIDGTHTNMDAINRHVQTDPTGRVVGLKGGPDAEGIQEALKFATLVLLHAIEAMSRAFPQEGLEDRLRGFLVRFRALPGSEG